MAKTGKPNILFIMADDIGWFNVSCYNHGIMGYRTPNIDRIARDGAMFTDFYGQQSCTAGRAAFITGQQPIRTLRPSRRCGEGVRVRPHGQTPAVQQGMGRGRRQRLDGRQHERRLEDSVSGRIEQTLNAFGLSSAPA